MKTILLALFVAITFGVAINSQATAAAKNAVYANCQAARTTQTVSEDYCGELQDKYGITYMCAENNSSIYNNCWTETN